MEGMMQAVTTALLCFGVWLITLFTGDISIEKATLAQELCIKANSKAVSFDRIEVTCQNKAVIPLKGD